MLKKLLPLTVIAGISLGTITFNAVAEKADTWSIIHAGTLLADARQAPRSQQSIVVKNGEIFDIREGYISPSDVTGAENARVINLKDRFVMAGMIDSHTHVTMQRQNYSRKAAVTTTNSEYALTAVVYAGRILNAGFTTIRNVGGPREAVFALRDSIAKGQIQGPRIVAGGLTISPLGGHGDRNGFRPDVFGTPHSGICNGADDCRRAVRDQIKYGADMIKYVATGGVLSKIATGTGQQFTDAEQAAIVQSAHAMGRKVAAHAHGKGGIDAALRAGVDSIEHGSFLDKGSIKLFKKTGAYLVPTLLAGATVVHIATNNPGFFMPEVEAKAKRVGPAMARSLYAAYKAGVKIAFGTDSGVSNHGLNGRELILMVKAGMTEKDVLISATVNAADLLGLSDQIGTLEAGKSADIIAVKGDPLKNMAILLKPGFVMARGIIAVE